MAAMSARMDALTAQIAQSPQRGPPRRGYDAEPLTDERMTR
jgi:hypothetical protein